MKLDLLVFAAHPDDAELALGGTILKFVSSGYKAGIIDLTKGEMSTRGTPETRKIETDAASKILKLTARENLEIPDGNIELTKTNLEKVVGSIRKYTPRIIFAPYFNDRHPDHIQASILIKKAMFVSGLVKFKTVQNGKSQKEFRPEKLFYFMQTYKFQPSFIIDISEQFEQKMKAVRTYKSQFFNPIIKGPETFISKPEFIEYLEARSKFYGFEIGKKYGEPFYCEEQIELKPDNFFTR